MRLKQLELHGFKSFADKTRIDFHEGVTAIVGPNGCGKSNVVDGVRWALGETSARALRGGEMADVIFNGTDRRKPLGMAEVSLTFDGCESIGMDFDEVCVTRRVFRDGKGEYELNGTPCRLKDINKLFMDTGVGRSAYSIMEQGKIDMLLSAKPEDRRMVFEEAAGITKSKSEKKEALRKLEYTEANLLRVTDILTELKRQVGTSQRQAAKARRWQELHKDVKVLDTHLLFKRYHEHAAERAELENSVQSLRARQTELEERIRGDEVQVAAGRMELREMENTLTDLRHQLNERQSHIHAAENRIGFNDERQRELDGLIFQNQHDIDTNQSRLGHQEEELKTADSALEAIRENMMRQREQIEEHGRITQGAREEKARIERALREARQAIHSAEGVIISAKAEIASHQSQTETDRGRQDQLQRDVAHLHVEREGRLAEEAEMKQRIEELHSEIESQELALHQRDKELQAAEIELEQVTRRHHEVLRHHSERASRADILRQLIAAGEGLEKGTQEVLKGLDNPDFFKGGTRGLLSNFIEVERQYIPAIEAALGANLQAVLVANSMMAENMVDVLSRDRLGQALVLPEDLLRVTGGYEMLTPPPGGLTWAADAVQARDSVRAMVHQLLANVLIVPDLAAALRLKRENPEIAFATLHGEYISHEGVVHGGAAADKTGSMLQRHAELRDLEQQVTRLEADLAGLERDRTGKLDHLRSLKTQLDEQREVLQSRRVQESQMSGQLSLILRDLQALATRAEGLEWELSELQKRQDAVGRRLDEATARQVRAAEEAEAMRGRAASYEADMESAARNEADAMELLNELRTALAVEQRAEQALQEQRAPMSGRVKELQDAISRRQREIESYQERISHARGENVTLNEDIAAARIDAGRLAGEIESAGAAREARAAAVADKEAQLSAARREIQHFADQRGREEVRSTQITLRMENLHAAALERYRVDLTAFEQDVHALLSVIAAQKAARDKQEKRKATLAARAARAPDADGTAELNAAEEAAADAVIEAAVRMAESDVASADLAAIDDSESEIRGPFLDDDEIDWQFVESAAAELKQRLDGMGPVNLDAIQEFEELEERHNFLQRESDDLAGARVELLGIIQRINEETKKRFVETFAKVKQNFRATFKELFGQGAQADLLLIDEDDPLESGIEVIAKPPGKKPTSITLLSGGERSMTAVALLFSIYMVKPSPFCILDELDAPLDDSNIGRFLKMLDKFIEKSQFVIVTHNKRTMRRADVMYGVTMEEFGVSKPVGMRLSDDDGRHPAAATEHEAPPSEMPADAEPAEV